MTYKYDDNKGLQKADWKPDDHIRIMKVNKMHYFSDLIDNVLYMFQTDLLSIISSLNTVYMQ